MLTLALLGRCDCQQTSGAFRASVACLWGWGVNDYSVARGGVSSTLVPTRLKLLPEPEELYGNNFFGRK